MSTAGKSVSTADLAEARALSAAFVDSIFSRAKQSAAETELRWQHAIETARGARRAALRLILGQALCDWCSHITDDTSPVYIARQDTGLRCCRGCSLTSRFVRPPGTN